MPRAPILRSDHGGRPARAPRTVPDPCRPTSLPGSDASAVSPPWRRWCPGSRCTRAGSGPVDLFRRPDNNKPAELRYLDRHSGELLGPPSCRPSACCCCPRRVASVPRHPRPAPEEPFVVAVMAVYGPVALALVTVARAVALGVIAGDFAGQSTQTLKAADDAFDDPALLIPQYPRHLGGPGAGLLAREGLAGRDAGGPAESLHGDRRHRAGPGLRARLGSLILPVWLIALGALFAGFWPRGLPPAWESGEALPWPGSEAGTEPEPAPARARRGGGAGPQRRGRPRWSGCAPDRPAARPARPRIGWRRMGARESIPGDRPCAGVGGPGRVWGGKARHRQGRVGDPERITRQTGVKIDTVRCPDEVVARRGETFRCVALASNGQRARVEVSQRDDEGSVSWRLIGRASQSDRAE